MSEPFAMFRCGDGESLVTFVYGESSPAQRETIASHVAVCTLCAEEVAALGVTRQQLAAWTPPEQTLGFRITRSEAEASQASPETGAAILRPAVWWKQPLPAWAQVAAAVVIFASGMALGGTWRSPAPTGTPVTTITAAPAAEPGGRSTAADVTRQDLERIEQRFRAEITQLRTTSPGADAGTGDTRAVMQRVSQMLAASEARQQQELDFRTSVLARDWSNRRTIDLANIEQRLGSTTVRVLNNQQDINTLAQRVGYSPASSPYVP